MDESTYPPMITPRLIGRTSQLATLHTLVERAKGGEGCLALISGEAGIGKSRLVAEIKGAAAAQGFLLLQGQCFPADLTYPYAPLLDLFRSLFASPPPVALAAELERVARDLFPLLPEVVSTPSVPRVSLEPEQEKRRLFAVLIHFFLGLSASSPLLIIMEDVHWSDSTSLDVLHLLARRMASHPLLLLVTYRQDEMHAGLSHWLAQLTRERLAKPLRLAPLARTDVDLMLSALFEPQHTAFDMRRFLHGELLDTLYTLTEGNPFFVEETLSAMIAADDLFYVQGSWNRRALPAVRIPQSVQDAVHQRTRKLGEGARRVLTLAAVAGRHFDFALLQQLTGYDEEQLLQIMKELVSAHLVVEESSEQFAFRHALTRQAISTQLLARERDLIHRTIAETMEQLPPVALDAYVEDLANHFYQARDWHKVTDYALRAGEKAVRLSSHRVAVGYFSQALEAARHLSLSPSPMVYRARGQAYETLGEFEQAQQDYTQALEAARTIQDRVAEWQSTIDLGFLWAERDYAQAELWFRQALTLSQSLDDPALHARSLNRIGNWHLNVEQPHEALRYHQEALTFFQRLQDPHGIAETLDLLGMASYLGGDLIGGTSYYQQAISLWRSLDDKPGLTSSLATLALRGPTYQTDTMVSVADLAEARQDTEQALTIARAIGHRSAEAYALLQLGLCLGSQGEYGRAYEAAEQSLHLAEEIEHRQWQTAAHTVLGGMCSGMLAYPQAHEHFEQALRLSREMGSLFWTHIAIGYLASVTILLQDLAETEKLLQTAFRPETPAQTMAQRMVWCASVELALARGDASRALEIIDRLDAEVAQGTLLGQSSLRVLKLRGEALAALQRPDEAEAALRAVHAQALVQGARPVQWRVCLALGDLYQAQSRKAEAEQAFANARALIEELAATVADELLRDHFLRQAMALFPPTPISKARGAKQAPGGLTEREREVAALIARGKSNQAIAERLVVTKRTVETHIGNIMFKLGYTSRTQIAVWAVEAGLAGKAKTDPSP